MPQNVFSAGRDELLTNLAKRDAEARLDEEQRRRAAADEAAAAARTEQLGLQRRNTEALEGERTARTAEIERKTKEGTERDATVKRLIGVVTDETQPQKLRDQAGLYLDSMGIGKEALKSFMTQPKKDVETIPVMRTNPRTGKVEQIGDAPKGSHFVTEPAPKEPKEPTGGFKDSHLLPEGVKKWILSIQERGVPLPAARAELSKGWAQQQAAHEHADLGAAAEYLNKLYPPAPDPNSFTPRTPLAGGPDEGTRPAAPAATSSPAAEPPASTPIKLPPGTETRAIPGGGGTAAKINGRWIKISD